jgi:hypothetical protein
MILSPEILLAIVGVNTVIGLFALLAYLFAYLKVQTVKNLEMKSIRETVEGEGIFNANQVISIELSPNFGDGRAGQAAAVMG